MVDGIFYGLLVIVLLVTNVLHIKINRKQQASIDWWRNKCVKNEQDLRELKEKQNKRKKNIKGNIVCTTK